ncbi:MAG: hypothetical protein ABW321_35610 [Polyangiales bacterium]
MTAGSAKAPARATGIAVDHSLSRTLAAIVAAPLTASVLSAAIAAFFPSEGPLRIALGTHLLLPLWAALACLLPLARSGQQAWLLCAAIDLPLIAALVLRAFA